MRIQSDLWYIAPLALTGPGIHGLRRIEVESTDVWIAATGSLVCPHCGCQWPERVRRLFVVANVGCCGLQVRLLYESVQMKDRGIEKEIRRYLCRYICVVALHRLAACCCVIELVTGEIVR